MRTIESHQYAIERLCSGKPVLQKFAHHSWEETGVLSPACSLMSQTDEIAVLITKLPFDPETKRMLQAQPALCIMLYAAFPSAGEKSPRTNSIGLAVLSPEMELLARHTEPVLLPDQEIDRAGLHDGHLTKVGRRFIFTYTVYPDGNDDNPRTAMASTTDFLTWAKHGCIHGPINDRPNSNAMIFDRKIGSRFMMLYHPADGDNPTAVHWAEGEDVYREWRPKGFLIRPAANPEYADTLVRAGAPPMKLPDGRFVILYNVVNRRTDGTTDSTPGIALGDAGFRHFIVKRYEPLTFSEPAAGEHHPGSITISGAFLLNGGINVAYSTPEHMIRGFRIPAAELDRFCRR
jgi:predicted GH43/DUF377 family glycosyl hydrolase